MIAFYMSLVDTDEEKQSIKRIYEKYHDFFFRVAYRYLQSKEDADDAVHNLFLKIIMNKLQILSFDDTNLKNWSVTVIRHICIDILRKQKHFSDIYSFDDDDIDNIASNDNPIDFIVDRSESYELLNSALCELSEIESRLLEMKYTENLKFSEISEKVNLTNNQINAILRRAREKMRIKLKSATEGAEVTT
jgi:RNA polymerase sigma-70 factor (ECF subfamily)